MAEQLQIHRIKADAVCFDSVRKPDRFYNDCMNRRERLMATLAGQVVDRPAVCFYEINGLDEPGDFNDPFNIYTHPSWDPLIELAREKSDRIVMRSIPFQGGLNTQMADRTQVHTWFEK